MNDSKWWTDEVKSRKGHALCPRRDPTLPRLSCSVSAGTLEATELLEKARLDSALTFVLISDTPNSIKNWF